MKFKHNFYHFQKDILNKFESEVKKWDKKIHIVAPPGSWKTVVGIEMMVRFDKPTLILVSNITLQHQWKDKIEKLFLQEYENIDELVSTADTQQVKKINIITYQALTQSGEWDDIITQKVYESWFLDVKDEFKNFSEFEKYVESLKNETPKEFWNIFAKYRKKQKNLDNIEKLLTTKVISYFEKLKAYSIEVIILDEAHNLNAWWSKVLYYLRNYLWKSFIVWLTATPPFEDSDFFILDDDYSHLLWEVDYYIPQPEQL